MESTPLPPGTQLASNNFGLSLQLSYELDVWGKYRAGLLACELLGQQQTVIKPLGDALRDMPGLTGGAIMPDGRVGLILDAAGLVELANQEKGGE